MKNVKMTLTLFSICLIFCAVVCAEDDVATTTIAKYFKAIGGIENIMKIKTLSAVSAIEAFGISQKVIVHHDGRFRTEQENAVTLFDGKDYWQTYCGLLDTIPEEQQAQQHVSLYGTFYNDLIDSKGTMAKLTFLEEISKRGEQFTVLVQENSATKIKRHFYFNNKTGYLDKITEFVPDEEYRERKNVYTFKNYETFGEFSFPTFTESLCLTTNQQIQFPTTYSQFVVNGTIDEKTFVKPTSAVAAALLKDGVIHGEIIGFSQRLSFITNITQDIVNEAKVSDGDILVLTFNDETIEFPYFVDLNNATNIGQGDYLAAFNNTPALWLVKAYVGMGNAHKAEKGMKFDLSIKKQNSDSEKGKNDEK